MPRPLRHQPPELPSLGSAQRQVPRALPPLPLHSDVPCHGRSPPPQHLISLDCALQFRGQYERTQVLLAPPQVRHAPQRGGGDERSPHCRQCGVIRARCRAQRGPQLVGCRWLHVVMRTSWLAWHRVLRCDLQLRREVHLDPPLGAPVLQGAALVVAARQGSLPRARDSRLPLSSLLQHESGVAHGVPSQRTLQRARDALRRGG